MAAVHMAGVRLGELRRVGTLSGLLHDDVGVSVVERLQEPRVVGAPLVGCAPDDSRVILAAAARELADRREQQRRGLKLR